jgi:hypothetical protein
MKLPRKAQRSQVIHRHQIHGVGKKKAKERQEIKESKEEIKALIA